MAKLREAEKPLGQRATISAVCKKLGVSQQSFYRWRMNYGPSQEDDARRLRAMEQESVLKTRCRGAGVEYLDAEGPAVGKLLSPVRRRAEVCYVQRRHAISKRRACAVVGQHRSTWRYAVVRSDFEDRLVEAMHAQAQVHPRWGYRKVHLLVTDDG